MKKITYAVLSVFLILAVLVGIFRTPIKSFIKHEIIYANDGNKILVLDQNNQPINDIKVSKMGRAFFKIKIPDKSISSVTIVLPKGVTAENKSIEAINNGAVIAKQTDNKLILRKKSNENKMDFEAMVSLTQSNRNISTLNFDSEEGMTRYHAMATLEGFKNHKQATPKLRKKNDNGLPKKKGSGRWEGSPYFDLGNYEVDIGGSYGEDPRNKVDDFYTDNASLINPDFYGTIIDVGRPSDRSSIFYSMDPTYQQSYPQVGKVAPIGDIMNDNFNEYNHIIQSDEYQSWIQKGTQFSSYYGSYQGVYGDHYLEATYIRMNPETRVVTEMSRTTGVKLTLKGFYPIIKWDTGDSISDPTKPYNFSLKYQDLDSAKISYFYQLNGGMPQKLAVDQTNPTKYLSNELGIRHVIPKHPDLRGNVATHAFSLPANSIQKDKVNNLKVYAIDNDDNKSMVLEKNIKGGLKNPEFKLNQASKTLNVGGSYGEDPLNKVEDFYTDSASLINPTFDGTVKDYDYESTKHKIRYYVDNDNHPIVDQVDPLSEMLKDTFSIDIPTNGSTTNIKDAGTQLGSYKGKYVNNHPVNAFFVDETDDRKVKHVSDSQKFNLNIKGFYPIIKWEKMPVQISKKQDFDFTLKFQDLDSSKLNFYYSVDDGPAQQLVSNVDNLGKFLTDNKDNTIGVKPDLSHTIMEKDFKIDNAKLKPAKTNKIKVYAIDNDGNKSMILNHDLIVNDGSLAITSVPNKIDWDEIPIGYNKFEPSKISGDLSITDSRVKKGQWKLFVKETKPLESNSGTLQDGQLSYYNNGKKSDIILNRAVEVYQKTNSDDLPFVVNGTWDNKNGLFFQSYVGTQLINTNYSGELTWYLNSAPENK